MFKSIALKWLAAGTLSLLSAIVSSAQAQPAEVYGRADPAARAGGRMTIGSLTEPPALDPYHQAADARIRVTVLAYQGLFL